MNSCLYLIAQSLSNKLTVSPLSQAQLDIMYDQIQSEQPTPTIQSQFNYAWGLIKSNNKSETKQGLEILIKIFKNSPQRRRECLYYLSLGFYKINELQDLKRYADLLLKHEPDNLQAIHLKSSIEEKIAKGELFVAISQRCLRAVC